MSSLDTPSVGVSMLWPKVLAGIGLCSGACMVIDVLARKADEAGDGFNPRGDADRSKLRGAVLGHARGIGRAHRPGRQGVDYKAHMLADVVDRQLQQDLLLGHGSPPHSTEFACRSLLAD